MKPTIHKLQTTGIKTVSKKLFLALILSTAAFANAQEGVYYLMYVDEDGIVTRENERVFEVTSNCRVGATPWKLGGNTLNLTDANSVGTCNNYDFILKTKKLFKFQLG